MSRNSKSSEGGDAVLNLPAAARRPETCLKWTSTTPKCLSGIDDVVVTNISSKRSNLHVDFDQKFKSDDWLLLPSSGASINVGSFN